MTCNYECVVESTTDELLFVPNTFTDVIIIIINHWCHLSEVGSSGGGSSIGGVAAGRLKLFTAIAAAVDVCSFVSFIVCICVVLEDAELKYPYPPGDHVVEWSI